MFPHGFFKVLTPNQQPSQWTPPICVDLPVALLISMFGLSQDLVSQNPVFNDVCCNYHFQHHGETRMLLA